MRPAPRGISVLAAFGAALAFALLMTAIAVTYPHDLENAEGVLLAPALRLAHGDAIWGREVVFHEPHLIAAYGPVFYALLAPMLALSGPSFLPGRILASLGFAACSTLVFRLTRAGSTTSSTRLAPPLAAVAGFLSAPAVFPWLGLMRVDSIAVAFALGAIALSMSGPVSSRAAVGAGALAALAALTKSSVVAAPAAIVLWHLLANRRMAAATFLGGAALTSLVATVVLVITGNDGFFGEQAMHAAIRYEPATMLRIAAKSLLAPAILGSLVLAAPRVLTRPVALPILYAAVALLLDIATAGRAGANTNHFLEATAAITIAGGLGLAWLDFTGAARTTQLAEITITAFLGAELIFFDAQLISRRVHAEQEKNAQMAAAIETLRNRVPDGATVISEYPDLVLRAGRLLDFNDVWFYRSSEGPLALTLQSAIRGRTAAAIVTRSRWKDLPGYTEAEPKAAEPSAAAYPGPIVYLRDR